MNLKCINCSSLFDLDTIMYNCSKCNDLLEVQYDLNKISNNLDSKWRDAPLSVWKYQDFLPIDQNVERVTLKEGGTRLHNSKKLSRFFGIVALLYTTSTENHSILSENRNFGTCFLSMCE